MSDLIVIENTNIELIEVAPRMEVTPQFNNTYQEFISEMDDRVDDAAIYASNAANSAGQAATSAATAASQASAASNSASQAASFVGGNWPLPHGHVTGPIAVDPTFQRLSDAYDDVLKRYEYNQRRWNQNGTLIEEGTTNLLPAGAEDFVTRWSNGTGETCTVTDYPVNIPGIGNVIAKRITGNGLGSNIYKRYTTYTTGIANPHTSTVSCWCMSLNPAKNFYISDTIGSSTIRTLIPTTMTRISSTQNVSSGLTSFGFLAHTITDVLDIVVYAPQIELKAYATNYTPPETTRAAESLTIPVGAVQKNLLTLNQATGGDTLGDTTGFLLWKSTITRDTTEKWNGTGSIKVVTNGETSTDGIYLTPTIDLSMQKIYTASFWAKGTGTIRLYQTGLSSPLGSPISLTSTWTRYSVTFTPTVSGSFNYFIATNSIQAITFYIDGLQLEEGTTASDWTLPAVDYSNALIDPAQPFSIEFDATPWVDDKSFDRYLFEFVSGSSMFAVYINVTSGYYRFYHINGGSTRSILSSVAVVAGVKKTHKISVSGGTITYVIDGATINTTIFDGMPSLLNTSMFIGSRASGSAHRNASFSNVRIRKGVALTAAERAYTGQLLPDEYTTYYSDLKESISTRPYHRDALGNAVTLQPANTVPATISYNAAKQPTSITNAGLTHTLTYNTDGSVNTIYDGIYTRTCNYSAGNLINIT